MKYKEVQVEYCPTEEMIADYMSKPLEINLSGKHHCIGQQECVGRNISRLRVKGLK
jgi:hypothetical protein